MNIPEIILILMIITALCNTIIIVIKVRDAYF